MVQLPRLLLLLCGVFAVSYATPPHSDAMGEIIIEQWKLDYHSWRSVFCPDCMELCLSPTARWNDRQGWIESLLLLIVRIFLSPTRLGGNTN